MRVLMLMLLLVFPIMGFAEDHPIQYHANIVTVTYIEEVIFSALFFLVNVLSSIFYDVLGPYKTFLFIYFIVSMYVVYKSILTARFHEMFKTVYVSPTNNLLTKMILYFVFLHTLLIPVQVDMYKFGGDKTLSSKYDIKLQTQPQNRIKNDVAIEDDKRYHDEVYTLSNANLLTIVLDANSQSLSPFLKNKAPLLVAGPVNFFNSVFYGIPFLSEEKLSENFDISEESSVVNVVKEYLPSLDRHYHKVLQDPSELITVYVEYFNLVSNGSNLKKDLTGSLDKYLEYMIQAFNTTRPWEKNKTFTYVFEPDISTTNEQQLSGESMSGEVSEVLEILIKRYNTLVKEKVKDLKYGEQNKPVTKILIQKLAILEFMGLFGFEEELKDPLLYEKLNNTISKTPTESTSKTIAFIKRSEASNTGDYYVTTLNRIFTAINADSEYIKELKIEDFQNDGKFLYNKILDLYMGEINPIFTDVTSSDLHEVHLSKKLPSVKHPMSGIFAIQETTGEQRFLLKDLAEKFVKYNRSIESWTTEDSEVYWIRERLKELMAAMYDSYSVEQNADPFDFAPKAHLNINTILDKLNNFVEKIIAFNRKRTDRYLDRKINMLMFKEFVKTDFHEGGIKDYLNRSQDDVLQNHNLKTASNEVTHSETQVGKTERDQIRIQSKSLETSLYDTITRNLNAEFTRIQGTTNGTGYMINRRNSPVFISYTNNNIVLKNSFLSERENYYNYIYNKIFHKVLSGLYNTVDTKVNIRFDYSLLQKSVKNINHNGVNFMKQEAEGISNITSKLYTKPFVANGILNDKNTEMDNYTTGNTQLISVKDENGNYLKSKEFYDDFIKNSGGDSLYDIISDYNTEMIKTRDKLDEEFKKLTDSTNLSSTDYFYWKIKNYENIPFLRNTNHQSKLFYWVLDDLNVGLNFYKVLNKLYERDINSTKKVLGHDLSFKGERIKNVLRLYFTKVPPTPLEKFGNLVADGAKFLWGHVKSLFGSPKPNTEEYKKQERLEKMKEDMEKAKKNSGWMFSTLAITLVKNIYVPMLNGFHAAKNENLSLLTGNSGSVAAWFAAYGGLSFLPLGKDFFQASMIVMAAKGLIMGYIVLHIALSIIMLFMQFFRSLTGSLFGILGGVMALFRNMVNGERIHESLDKLFDSAIKFMLIQIFVFIMILASLIFSGIISFIMNTYYLEEVYYGKTGYLQDYVMIVLFGILTHVYIKILKVVVTKITNDENFMTMSSLESTLTGRLNRVGDRTMKKVGKTAVDTAGSAAKLAGKGVGKGASKAASAAANTKAGQWVAETEVGKGAAWAGGKAKDAYGFFKNLNDKQ